MRAAGGSGREDLGVPRAEARSAGEGAGRAPRASRGSWARRPPVSCISFPPVGTLPPPRGHFASILRPGGEVGAPAGRPYREAAPSLRVVSPPLCGPLPSLLWTRGLAALTSSAREGEPCSLTSFPVAQ